MRLSNEFLDQAIPGLRRRDTWITLDAEGDFGIRTKDNTPLRVIKNFSYYFGYVHYTNLDSETVVSAMNCLKWAGIDTEKMTTFLMLFDRATRQQNVVYIERVLTSLPSKIQADTFEELWSQKENGNDILLSFPIWSVCVSLGEEDFSVRGTQSGTVSIYKQPSVESAVMIDCHKDKSFKTQFLGEELIEANTLDAVLMKAYNSLSKTGAKYSNLIFPSGQDQMSPLLDGILISQLENPDKPLPFNLEEIEVELEGFQYKLAVNLQGQSFNDESMWTHPKPESCPSLEFIGKKPGRADRKVAIALQRRTVYRIKREGCQFWSSDAVPESSDEFKVVKEHRYVFATRFFDAEVPVLVSAFHDKLFGES